MKLIIITFILATLSTATQAQNLSAQTLQDSSIQTVAYVVADMIGLSSRASSVATTESRKLEAKTIQNDIQNYDLNGYISIYLSEKINMVLAVNSELSEQEAIEALILATDSILN